MWFISFQFFLGILLQVFFSTLVFLIIKMILFFIALCVAPFYEFVFVFRLCSTLLFHFGFFILFSTLQGSFNLCYFSFIPVFGLFLKTFFNECPEVPLCGWWYIKLKELSLDWSTHLFLVMFFLAHHRAPFSSEYFPPFFLLFSPFFLPTYCQWFCSFQLHKFSPWDYYLLVLMFFTFIAFSR